MSLAAVLAGTQAWQEGVPCPHCAQTRTWWLPRMGRDYPRAWWCVDCHAQFDTPGEARAPDPPPPPRAGRPASGPVTRQLELF